MTADDFMKLLDETESVILSRKLFKELLDNQKSQNSGHWCKDFTCLFCGCKFHLVDIVLGDNIYCPNCGAKMIEPQERETKDETYH